MKQENIISNVCCLINEGNLLVIGEKRHINDEPIMWSDQVAVSKWLFPKFFCSYQKKLSMKNIERKLNLSKIDKLDQFNEVIFKLNSHISKSIRRKIFWLKILFFSFDGSEWHKLV